MTRRFFTHSELVEYLEWPLGRDFEYTEEDPKYYDDFVMSCVARAILDKTKRYVIYDEEAGGPESETGGPYGQLEAEKVPGNDRIEEAFYEMTDLGGAIFAEWDDNYTEDDPLYVRGYGHVKVVALEGHGNCLHISLGNSIMGGCMLYVVPESWHLENAVPDPE